MKTEKSDNELIAEFMGAKQDTVHAPVGLYIWYDVRHFGQNLWNKRELAYSTSWDWTMPACRKLIADLLVLIYHLQQQDTIDGDALHEAKRLKANLYHELACMGLPRVHAALVEGIRWYNSQSDSSIKE